jgi:hypothetical protein
MRRANSIFVFASLTFQILDIPRRLIPVASAASAKTDKLMAATSSEATSIPGLCLAASLMHGKPNALNHKEDGKWNQHVGNDIC